MAKSTNAGKVEGGKLPAGSREFWRIPETMHLSILTYDRGKLMSPEGFFMRVQEISLKMSAWRFHSIRATQLRGKETRGSGEGIQEASTDTHLTGMYNPLSERCGCGAGISEPNPLAHTSPMTCVISKDHKHPNLNSETRIIALLHGPLIKKPGLNTSV